MTRTRRRPRSPLCATEDQVHLGVVEALVRALPGAVVHHSPNQQAWSALDRALAERVVGKLKRMGMVPGFADLIVLWRGMAWCVEVKTETGRQQETQRDFERGCTRNRIPYRIVRSVDDAVAVAKEIRAAERNFVGYVEPMG